MDHEPTHANETHDGLLQSHSVPDAHNELPQNSEQELVAEVLLIEEVSIDGMCGVY